MKRTEVYHLQRDLPVEASVNGWGGEVDDDSNAGQRAAALHASSELEIPVEMNTFTGDGEHVPGMFAERRKDY